MQLTELGGHLDTLLDASRLKDYCPNGLQVEGRAEVRRVLCGVTASQALLVDLLGWRFRTLSVPADPACPTCAG